MSEFASDAQFFATATDEALLAGVYPTWFDGSLREHVLATWPARLEALRQALGTVLRMTDGVRRSMPWPGLAQRTALMLIDRLPVEEREATLRELAGARQWTPTIDVELRRRAGRAENEGEQRLVAGWSAQVQSSPSVEVRCNAAMSLGVHGSGEEVLREALTRDLSPRERAACLYGLAHLHLPDVLEPLLALVRDESDRWCRQAAFNALAGLGDVRALDTLLEVWLTVPQPEIGRFRELPTFTDGFRRTHLAGLQRLLDRIEAVPKLAAASRVMFYVASQGYSYEPLLSELLARLATIDDPAALLARVNLYLRLVAPHRSAGSLVEALSTAVHRAIPHLARGEARTREEKQFVKLSAPR